MTTFNDRGARVRNPSVRGTDEEMKSRIHRPAANGFSAEWGCRQMGACPSRGGHPKQKRVVVAFRFEEKDGGP